MRKILNIIGISDDGSTPALPRDRTAPSPLQVVIKRQRAATPPQRDGIDYSHIGRASSAARPGMTPCQCRTCVRRYGSNG